METKYSEEYFWKDLTRHRNSDYIEGLQRTRLVQRLGPPEPEEDGVQLIQSDAWLGIGAYMGMNNEMRQIFSSLCTLEYMGASEYEWGAVPKAIISVCHRAMKKELTSFEHVVTGSVICGDFFADRALKRLDWFNALSEEQKKRTVEVFENSEKNGKEELFGEVSLYVIAPTAFAPHVVEVLDTLANREDGRTLKEPSNLRAMILCPKDLRPEFHHNTVGWFDIENDFLFFSEKELWLKWLHVLGIKPLPETKDKHLSSTREILETFEIF